MRYNHSRSTPLEGFFHYDPNISNRTCYPTLEQLLAGKWNMRPIEV